MALQVKSFVGFIVDWDDCGNSRENQSKTDFTEWRLRSGSNVPSPTLGREPAKSPLFCTNA